MLKIKNRKKTIITENCRAKLLIFIRYCTKPSNMYARTIATNIGAIVCMSMYVISIEKINTKAKET